MAEEIAFKNGWISKSEGLVSLTLTMDRLILHTIVHHSSNSTNMPYFIEIKETFLWTDGRARTYERLSWPSWLTYSGRLTHICGHPSATGRAWDRESSLVKDRRSTNWYSGRKSPYWAYPTSICCPRSGWPRWIFCIRKTRVPSLSYGVVCVTLGLAVLVAHIFVTDRKADAQTDTRWRQVPR